MTLRDFLRDENGAASAEYALILTILGSGMAAAIFFFGSQVSVSITDTGNDITICTTTADSSC